MPTNLSSIKPLLTQFLTRYPAGQLVTELLAIHQGNYVVRALAQVGGVTLATGMAALADIEQSEDRAKVRALMALGIEPFPGAELPTQRSEYTFSMSSPMSSPPAPTTDSVGDSLLPSARPDLSPPPIDPALPTKPLNFPTAATAPVPLPEINPQPADSSPVPSSMFPLSTPTTEMPLAETEEPDDHNQFGLLDKAEAVDSSDHAPHSVVNDLSPPPELTTELSSEEETTSSAKANPEPKAAKPSTKGKSSKRKAEVEVAPSVDEGNDRSEEIAKIGVEMKRLGWTTEQGRNYLKRTYGKRSRQELNDDELLDFLLYLELQPSPSDSLF